MVRVLEIDAETEAQLAAEASGRGLKTEDYIVEKLKEPHPAAQISPETVRQAVERIGLLRKGMSLGGLKIANLTHEGHRF